VNLQQKAVKGVAWSAIQRVSSQIISFFVFLVLSRLLEPEAFGLFAMANVVLAFVQIFLDQGFSQAIVQREELNKAHLNTAFWANTVFGVAMAIVGVTLSNLMAKLFRAPDLSPVVQWMVISFIFMGLSSTQQALLQRDLAFRSLALRSLVAELIAGVVAISLAFLSYNVWSLVAQALIRVIVGMVILWMASDWRPGFQFSIAHLRALSSFGINIVGNRLVNFFNQRTDEILIGYFLGTSALGFYTIGFRILRVITRLLTESIDAVAFPTFSRLQVDRERFRQAFFQVIQTTSLIAFPGFLGISIIAPELVIAFFGEKWAPSIPVMQVLAFIGILNATSYFNATALVSVGKPFWLFMTNLINALMNIIAMLIAVRWGIVAVAVAYVIRGYFLAPIPIWLLHRSINLNVRRYLLQLLPAIVGSIVMGIGVLGIKGFFLDRFPVGINVVLYTVIGMLVYCLVIWLVFPSIARQTGELIQLIIPRWLQKKRGNGSNRAM
jgi:PST family polysaccharide transporter